MLAPAPMPLRCGARMIDITAYESMHRENKHRGTLAKLSRDVTQRRGVSKVGVTL
jgi:hypothetical protein